MNFYNEIFTKTEYKKEERNKIPQQVTDNQQKPLIKINQER